MKKRKITDLKIRFMWANNSEVTPNEMLIDIDNDTEKLFSLIDQYDRAQVIANELLAAQENMCKIANELKTRIPEVKSVLVKHPVEKEVVFEISILPTDSMDLKIHRKTLEEVELGFR